jgi:hypothetical protein
MKFVSSLAFALFGSGTLVSVSAQAVVPNLAQVAATNGFTTLIDAADATGLLGVLSLNSIDEPLSEYSCV